MEGYFKSVHPTEFKEILAEISQRYKDVIVNPYIWSEGIGLLSLGREKKDTMIKQIVLAGQIVSREVLNW